MRTHRLPPPGPGPRRLTGTASLAPAAIKISVLLHCRSVRELSGVGTPRERKLIRREFSRHFGQNPSVVDGIFCAVNSTPDRACSGGDPPLPAERIAIQNDNAGLLQERADAIRLGEALLTS